MRSTTETSIRNLSFFVFLREDGGPIRPEFFSQSWERLVRTSVFPRIRLHDLRHTHVTILLKAGLPVKVSVNAWATRARRSR